jgi:hypothetical protein
MRVWPLGVGLQDQASNHHKLRALRASVVSVVGKGEAGLRQVSFEKTNASEPVMTCRKESNSTSKPERVVAPGQVWRQPVYCPVGVRHVGGVSSKQALVRNSGTCRSDVKGDAQVDSLHKGQSTDAEHRGGVVRSRAEGGVMLLDRRGGVVQYWPQVQPVKG